MAPYTWSQKDRERYDQDREPPRRIWNYHRRTPVIRLSFLPLKWNDNWLPSSTKPSEFGGRFIAQRPQSLTICDVYPPACMRQKHGRFVLPSRQIPAQLVRNKRQVPITGLLDDYYVDGEHLIPTILAVLDGTPDASRGLSVRGFDAHRVCCLLEDFLPLGVEGFGQSNDEND